MSTEAFKGQSIKLLQSGGTFQLKAAPGRACRLIVWDVGTAWVLDFYDHASGNSNRIWQYVSALGSGRFSIDVPCTNGVRVVSGGTAAGDAIFTWS